MQTFDPEKPKLNISEQDKIDLIFKNSEQNAVKLNMIIEILSEILPLTPKYSSLSSDEVSQTLHGTLEKLWLTRCEKLIKKYDQ